MLKTAFRLAHFLCSDRQLALSIVTASLAKLEVHASKQDKRRYSDLKGHRTKVSKTKLQLLQLLICCEWEARMNSSLTPQEGDRSFGESLLERLVVYGIRLGLRRNAFYLNLAFSRILHDYSTIESRSIYDVLIQDPSRMRDDACYRRGKGLLMDKLAQRFCPFLRVVRTSRGELRFHSRSPTEMEVAFVQELLKHLVPWQTHCPVPASFDSTHHELSRLRFSGDHPDDEHPVEMARAHAILHPQCNSRLAQGLGLDLPEQRLRIPIPCSFTPDSSHDPLRRNRPGLSDAEEEEIKKELRRIEALRKQWSEATGNL